MHTVPGVMAGAAQDYRPRRPEESLLYSLVAEELETFLVADADDNRNS